MLAIKGRIFGAMPVTAKLSPAEVPAGHKTLVSQLIAAPRTLSAPDIHHVA
jgi:hypothetical protein